MAVAVTLVMRDLVLYLRLEAEERRLVCVCMVKEGKDCDEGVQS